MTWNDYYTLAEKYYRRHGNLATPSTYWCMGENLGAWLSRQRVCHLPDAPHPLTDQQVELLDALHMNWEIKRRDWEICFGYAERYYAAHGNLRVPKHYEVDGVNLSHWIWTQRRIYLKTTAGQNVVSRDDTNRDIICRDEVHDFNTDTGKKLTDEQIKRLESIGMNWAPKSKGFSYYYQMAEQFYHTYGHTDFPKGAVEINGEILAESGETLSAWKADQQQKFTEKKYDMKWEQIMKLREIGIISQEALSPWEKNYRAAEAYYKEHGDLLVPFSYRNEDGIRLGRWISTQRMKRNGTAANALTEEQIRRLDEIGMVWNAKKE